MSTQIADLNLSNQNVMPAQVYAPIEPQPVPAELEHELETEIKEAPPSSSSSCSCVDTYA